MIKALSLLGSKSSAASCPHFIFTPDISITRARPVWILELCSCPVAVRMLGKKHNPQLIYRYIFVCVHVPSSAITAIPRISSRAGLACSFLLVDLWNIKNLKIKFWYSKFSWGYKTCLLKFVLNTTKTSFSFIFFLFQKLTASLL